MAPPPALSPRQVSIRELVKALHDVVQSPESKALLQDLLRLEGVPCGRG